MNRLIFATPTLPPNDHPLRGYSEQMIHLTSSIYNMMLIVLVVLVLLLVAFSLFAYQKWLERQDIKAEREDIKTWRTDVVDLTAACGTILASIKGRALVFEQVEANRATKVERAAEDMKTAVEAVPKKTAIEVVSALEQKAAGESGTGLPVVGDLLKKPGEV